MLGAFVHGALTALHALGVVYNLRKKKWSATAVHATAAIYSLNAALQHAKDAGLFKDGCGEKSENQKDSLCGIS